MLKLFFKLNKPIQFYTYLPNIIPKLSSYINENDNNNNTNLHRWCHKKSEKYQYTCNWKTKLDSANIDNSL